MSSRWRSFWESWTEDCGAGPSSSAKAVAATVEPTVLPTPEERSTGLPPHSGAKDASPPQALRGVPHCDQQGDGRVRPGVHRGEQLWGVAFHEPGQAAFQGLDLVGELLDSVGQQAQGDAGGLRSDRLFVAPAWALRPSSRAARVECLPPSGTSAATHHVLMVP
ncbi:hypothetical protein [Streptomyces decoyicus]|uniref:hypothetical protein n=1 Tax=Streptomyces decoyicus TaxID=249567 RepID=UPI0037FED0E5